MYSKTELKRITLADHRTNPLEGTVFWSPIKSFWLLMHYGIALIGGALTFSISSVFVFVITTAITLCLGHSLGMHRRFIHNSYSCPIWLEYLFVHLGVIVGLAGPFGMMQTHDLRDWAQRQSDCHSYLRHGSNPLSNHHAFPDSAILGIYENQPDPGWWVLKILRKLGLVSNISFPENLPERKTRVPLSDRAKFGSVVKA